MAALLFGPITFGGCSRQATGLTVRVARLGRCGDLRDVVLDVLPGGVLRLNSENLKRAELGQHLHDIFRTRGYRYVFVNGDPNVSFGEVAEVIDIASTHVDVVTLLTPPVMSGATYEKDGACLDPNLPSEYITHPRHQ